ncbi:aminoacyl-histidine dipeptidase [Lentisphaerota bacterium ZTH]|nr:aminoacyl-histidine dipeptidase [Lentisphaerota bacterium]WET07638.1 aminoacyl-histidine dipeptidase [Lentisphaerota bacterium ZTH]
MAELKSKTLWDLFYDICKIPNPSGHEEKLCCFLKTVAAEAGLSCKVDKAGNLLIEKPASPGREKCKSVIMQGHLDMVPQMIAGLDFDFKTDAIVPVTDGEWIKASGTTLGADNGIGTAAAMAVLLDDSLEHGPLKALFTVEEEVGLRGASEVDPEFLDADILLNLDSEDEGEIFMGCAGGARLQTEFNIEWTELKPATKAYRVSVSGLPGGHSGCDIHQNRGNAIKLIVDLLRNVSSVLDLNVSILDGGTLDNAIPREAFAIVTVPEDEGEVLETATQMFAAGARAQHNFNYPIMEVAEEWDMPSKTWSPEFLRKVLNSLHECPHGVIAWSKDFPGVVETSTNLAVVESSRTDLRIKTSQRSFSNADRAALTEKISKHFDAVGGKSTVDNEYPGWKPNPESEIVNLVCSIYKELFKAEPRKTAIHAGLECGLMGNKNPNIDMVSFGPDIKNPHSPSEQVSIASVDRFYQLLTEVVSRIK